ncbi:hypothetical protein C7974DRAFT_218606 [Boeremia exigua]|uniref:uncharacterized protein n=1 Tax=Boeremia exigua TaxID=749465 RepID=UPI001E8E5ED8|nr:uncharacterized protein C7974DRAFT_218606 [Boeremia exigua]KAH6622238.1 hypothetical protein C7974DRAFT_218606 [Boeremia exigua]
MQAATERFTGHVFATRNGCIYWAGQFLHIALPSAGLGTQHAMTDVLPGAIQRVWPAQADIHACNWCNTGFYVPGPFSARAALRSAATHLMVEGDADSVVHAVWLSHANSNNLDSLPAARDQLRDCSAYLVCSGKVGACSRSTLDFSRFSWTPLISSSCSAPCIRQSCALIGRGAPSPSTNRLDIRALCSESRAPSSQRTTVPATNLASSRCFEGHIDTIPRGTRIELHEHSERLQI